MGLDIYKGVVVVLVTGVLVGDAAGCYGDRSKIGVDSLRSVRECVST